MTQASVTDAEAGIAQAGDRRNYVSPDQPNVVWETLVKPKLFNGVTVFPLPQQK